MIAAVYARKSTEQNVGEDAKSVTRQIELARAFAATQGWSVSDDHIYVDAAVSGADFVKRDGLTRLLAAAGGRPSVFQAIVTMDESRLGRDQYRTAYVLQQIVDAGVQLWYYQERRQAKLDDATGKFLESVRGFAAEMEREKARHRTREALRAKASRGFVAGGKVYGYTNVRQGSSHVTRAVNEAEATVLRRVFQMTADGTGLLRIAKTLNEEGLPSPKRDGWASSSIREMLRRDLYRGRVVYGKTRWQDKGGTKVKVDVAESEWLVSKSPELQIVPEVLWKAAHARIDRTRQTYTGLRGVKGGPRPGQLNGRPESALIARHLLSGFLRCGVCAGNMFVAPVSGKRGKVSLYYRCTTHHKRGNTRCPNRHGVPYNEITQAVIDHFSSRFLTPGVLKKFLEDEAAAREPEAIRAERQGLETDVRRLDVELARLTEAVATGAGELPALVAALKHKQRARDNAAARVVQLVELEQAHDRFDLAEQLAAGNQLVVDLEELLQNDPATARGVLRTLLVTPIAIKPVETAEGVFFEYSGRARLDPVLAGRIGGANGAARVTKANTTELVPPG